jgi:F420-dependent oxidoreductase-like protein
MKLGMAIEYARDPLGQLASVPELEKAGLDMVWVAEAYGLDAVSVMGYLAAITERVEIAAGILPIYTRTPALIAQTAVGLDTLTGGRFVLGLGASGPQVIEGWHGVPYHRPLQTTRELIEICRKVWRREEPLSYEGEVFTLPLPAAEGTGLGKPLKIINHPPRPDIPIMLASLGPKNVQLTAEMADRWLPILFVPERADLVWGEDLAAGKARRDPSLGDLEIVAGGIVAIGKQDEVAPLRELARPTVALYVGGMGSRQRNFYNDLMVRYGWEQEAGIIQDLYLEGRKEEAMAAIPDEFLELTSLCGDESYIRDRIEAYAAAGVTTLSLIPVGDHPTAIIEKLRSLTD